MLEREIEYFEAHRDELLEKYRHQFVVIKSSELIGAFSTVEEALSEGARRFGLEPFLVRRVAGTEEPISIPALTLGILGANTPRPVRGKR